MTFTHLFTIYVKDRLTFTNDFGFYYLMGIYTGDIIKTIFAFKKYWVSLKLLNL